MVAGLVLVCLVPVAAAAINSAPGGARSLTDIRPAPNPPDASHHDVSPPLTDLPVAPPPAPNKLREHPVYGVPVPGPSGVPDPVVQAQQGTAAAAELGAAFEGVGQGFTGPSGTFSVTSAPPDTNGAVGPNHYLQIVNTSFAVFNKSGSVLYGPVPTSTLWGGFGGGCQTNNDGDGTVVYDRLANRWIITQFSVTAPAPYSYCVAVSTSGNPTGSYYRYEFSGFGNEFPDYPKLAVWPDAYYTSFNLFRNGTVFDGPEVCAYDRARMLAGQAATQQCFTLSTAFGNLLPSDLDGSAAPPAGAPDYLLSFGTNSLQLWKFHVDWATPANSTFTGPTSVPVAAFSPACDACIPQPGTSQRLDAISDRLMYRLAYRNFGDHQSLVVNHTVSAGSSAGVRWYELRNPGGTPSVYQQGTYAPDAAYRWMGSIAMDAAGNTALGYSVSSSTTRPGIHYTGRLAGDALGVMTQGEGVLIDGAGSQTGGLNRWGDYSSMNVDPSDDCTFWFTSEYLATSGSFNWHTRIGSFKLPGCGGPPPPSDFSISAAPSSVTVQQGGSGGSTISTAVTSGSAQTVALSASGQPAGTTVGFSPASISSGGSSTMTITVGAATATGPYTITITGTGTSATHTTTVTLTVTAPSTNAVANPGFELGLTGWGISGNLNPVLSATARTGTNSARVGSPAAFAGDSTLTQTVVVPAGSSQLSFWYQPHCTDGITWDQIQMELRSTGGATLATVLNACTNTGVWTQVTYDTTSLAGQTVVLRFNVHADGDPNTTYALIDDVALA